MSVWCPIGRPPCIACELGTQPSVQTCQLPKSLSLKSQHRFINNGKRCQFHRAKQCPLFSDSLWVQDYKASYKSVNHSFDTTAMGKRKKPNKTKTEKRSDRAQSQLSYRTIATTVQGNKVNSPLSTKPFLACVHTS